MGCSLRSSVAVEWAIGYVAGTLSSTARAEFETHLVSCSSCRELAGQQQAVWSSLEDWKSLEVSPDFDQKLFQRIAQDQNAAWWDRLSWSWSNWSWRPVLPVAAAAAALVLAFLVKEPSHVLVPSAEGQAKPRIEQQVQRALDDMEMLTQIGSDLGTEKLGSQEKI